MTTSPTPITREAAIATRVGEILEELDIIRCDEGVAASRHQAVEWLRIGLEYMQDTLGHEEMKQLLLDLIGQVQRRESGAVCRLSGEQQ